jgi:hypothetical protein
MEAGDKKINNHSAHLKKLLSVSDSSFTNAKALVDYLALNRESQ